jgi:hypothetical protein
VSHPTGLAPIRAAARPYVTVRPSFGEKGAIYAYRTEILWDEATSRPGVSRGGTLGRRVLAIWRSRGAEPVRSHLSRHQPSWPALADYGFAPDDQRRDVRRHCDALGGCAARCSPPIALLPVKNVPDAAYAGSRRATRAARSTASICSGSRASSSQCFCREPAGFVAVIVLARAATSRHSSLPT